MTIMKTAAAAALVAVAALATGGAPAEAHGKKGGWGKHNHIHHHGFKHRRPYYGPRIVVGSSYYGCGRWMHRYKATGNKKYLGRYYACIY